MHVMEAALLLVLATLASKLLDFAKFVRSKDWNAVVTQAATWAVGVGVVFLAGAAQAFEHLQIPGIDVMLSDLDTWSKVLVGTAATSALSKIYDFQKAIDNTDSAKTPPLLR